MKKLVLKMMAVCAGALIVSCGSGKNMLSVSSLDGEWNITEVDGQLRNVFMAIADVTV